MTTEQEEWRVIACAEAYEVSNLGLVRRRLRGKSTFAGKPVNRTMRKGDPYEWVTLCRGARGNQISRRVHILVAEAFVGPRPSAKHNVLHTDGNHTNNAAGNLRWGTQAENMRDAVQHGTIKRGEQKSASVLTDERVRLLRAAKASGERGAVTRLARLWGVNQGGANEAALGRTWVHVKTEHDTSLPPVVVRNRRSKQPGAVLEVAQA